MANTPCPPESREWLRILEEEPAPEQYRSQELTLLCSKYAVEASILIANMVDIFSKSSPSKAMTSYQDLTAAISVAELIVTPEMYVRAKWRLQEDEYNWNLYRCSRLKVHHLLALLANYILIHEYPEHGSLHLRKEKQRRMEHESWFWLIENDAGVGNDEATKLAARRLIHQREASLAIVQEMGLAIVESVPDKHIWIRAKSTTQSMSWVDAYRLIWPLTTVRLLSTVRPETRKMSQYLLHELGEHWGIMQCFKEYPPAAWVPTGADWHWAAK